MAHYQIGNENLMAAAYMRQLKRGLHQPKLCFWFFASDTNIEHDSYCERL